MSAVNPALVSVTDRPAFTAGGRAFDLAQVIAAADFRGDLAPLRQVSLSRARLAEIASERGLDADEAAVDEIAADYRYARDLTTAEECERWLVARGVSVEDFQAYCLRVYWERQLTGEGASEDAPDGAEPAEFGAWSQVDLLLSTEFDRLARQLAWRAALDCELARKPSSDQTLPSASPLTAAGVGQTEGTAGDLGWLADLRRMEAAFQTRCRDLLTPENQQRCLANLRLPLTRFELEVLELDGELAGREAYLCVTQDGMSLREVAVESSYALTSSSPLLEDLPEAWQPILLSAPIGKVLPPFGEGEERFLCFVKGKQDPSLDRSEVQARINRTLLGQHFMELETRHIQWHVMIDVSA